MTARAQTEAEGLSVGRLAQLVWEALRTTIWLFLMVMATITASMIITKMEWHRVTAPDFSHVQLVEGFSLINNFVIVAHIMTALPPLVIGPWLFWRGMLKRAKFLHIWLGLVYVYCIFASSVLGFLLAAQNPVSPVAVGGFGTLAVVWFVTTYMAFVTVRRKDLILHREWMIRSFMITLAVFTVRMLPQPSGEAMSQFYPLMTWLCWIPNLILAEIYVQLTDYRGNIAPRERRALRAKRRARAAAKARKGAGDSRPSAG